MAGNPAHLRLGTLCARFAEKQLTPNYDICEKLTR
jgi:hypothetical protein